MDHLESLGLSDRILTQVNYFVDIKTEETLASSDEAACSSEAEDEAKSHTTELETPAREWDPELEEPILGIRGFGGKCKKVGCLNIARYAVEASGVAGSCNKHRESAGFLVYREKQPCFKCGKGNVTWGYNEPGSRYKGSRTHCGVHKYIDMTNLTSHSTRPKPNETYIDFVNLSVRLSVRNTDPLWFAAAKYFIDSKKEPVACLFYRDAAKVVPVDMNVKCGDLKSRRVWIELI